MKSLKKCINSRDAKLASLLVVATMTLASTSAMSAITCFSTAIPVPMSTAGTYINLFTGVSNIAPASAVGWDLNPWGSSGIFLYGNNTAGGAATFVTGPGTTVSALASGTLIGPASTYTATSQTDATSLALYRAGVTPSTFLGIKFLEAGATYYGWVALTTTAPNGLPTTVNRWCYDNTPNTAIVAGTTPVALQKFSIE